MRVVDSIGLLFIGLPVEQFALYLVIRKMFVLKRVIRLFVPHSSLLRVTLPVIPTNTMACERISKFGS